MAPSNAQLLIVGRGKRALVERLLIAESSELKFCIFADRAKSCEQLIPAKDALKLKQQGYGLAESPIGCRLEQITSLYSSDDWIDGDLVMDFVSHRQEPHYF